MYSWGMVLFYLATKQSVTIVKKSIKYNIVTLIINHCKLLNQWMTIKFQERNGGGGAFCIPKAFMEITYIEWLECKYVIDASYEGELMIATGHVTYTFGRESQQQYNESFAGITNHSAGQFQYPVNPYQSDNATLLKWIQHRPDP